MDPADLDPDIQKKVEEQQRLLEQQQQDEQLLMLQQTALYEKQRDDEELLRQQHEAQIKMLEERRKDHELFQLQQEALRTTGVPPSLEPSISAPPHLSQTTAFHTVPSLAAAPQIVVTGPPGSALPPTLQQQMIARPPELHLSPQLASQRLSISAPGVPGDEDENIENEPPPMPPPAIAKAQQEAKEKEIKIPQALEQALAFKTERAKQVGVAPEDIDKLEKEGVTTPSAFTKAASHKLYLDLEEEDDDEEDNKPRKKDAKKKKKKKKKKTIAQKKEQIRKDREEKKKIASLITKKDRTKHDVEVEYIQERIDVDAIGNPMFRQFIKIFDMFKIAEPPDSKEDGKGGGSGIGDPSGKKPLKEIYLKKVPKTAMEEDDLDDDEQPTDDKTPKLSKRKMKQMLRMSVAELKQAVVRPDVVEMHDVTAKDPKLLVMLKSTRNTVPVPRHWCFKRKYLQGKRGIEKPPFRLPDFIQKTGIMEMRQALADKEEQRTMKAKMRERVRPKLGKIDIDYQKFHDAFFKWQTKPKMTIHGDLYYEGKEFETRLKEKKPGDLTDDLKNALGMPTGLHSHKVPPPWLIAMQRYGPPPSYPHLKIPGLNAPIPEGCSFGYHAGGWGKPPVDEQGNPLYGDVFGTRDSDAQNSHVDEEVDPTLWGELESESEESEAEESGEEDADLDEPSDGLVTPAGGLITPSGMTSIPAGMETPDMIELRKKKIEAEMEGGETPALYTILPEKRTEAGLAKSLMGSTHTYDLSGAQKGGSAPQVPGEGGGGVELALDPSELDLVNTEAMAARYEQTLREQQNQLQKEDLSDMVADHAARQKSKRKKQTQPEVGSKPKKYKEFKF